MRIVIAIVCVTVPLGWVADVRAQRFLDQLENVLDSEAAAEGSAKPTPVAVPGYLGLVAQQRDGRIVVELVREGTAAEKADLRVGDVITHIDDREISSLDEMSAVLANRAAGAQLNLLIQRGEKIFETRIVLGTRPRVIASNPPSKSSPVPPAEVPIDSLDALRELERLLDADSAPAPAPETRDATTDSRASRRERIAVFEDELDAIKRRIRDLEREVEDLADDAAPD